MSLLPDQEDKKKRGRRESAGFVLVSSLRRDHRRKEVILPPRQSKSLARKCRLFCWTEGGLAHRPRGRKKGMAGRGICHLVLVPPFAGITAKRVSVILPKQSLAQ